MLFLCSRCVEVTDPTDSFRLIFWATTSVAQTSMIGRSCFTWGGRKADAVTGRSHVCDSTRAPDSYADAERVKWERRSVGSS